MGKHPDRTTQDPCSQPESRGPLDPDPEDVEDHDGKTDPEPEEKPARRYEWRDWNP